jgi:Bacteriophage HK97-gp10, putative tail-component
MPKPPLSISSNADQIARRVAAWEGRVGPALARATLQAATVLVAAAKREAPVKSGRLRRSVSYQAGGRGRYVVSPAVPYAGMVHSGTRPHTIVPTRKRALFWRGARHPVKRVNHPGTRGNPYMTRALERSRPQIAQIARDAGASIVVRQG